ncbi:nuclear pore membrane glycoprotein 210-like isoform X2 [Dysidea avara]|uniref:nuclear pore membrane glycoprotein 210-like isoform X2 n=1 Tax=Dysidea avara TaxID=196820 RepID=UPI003332381B
MGLFKPKFNDTGLVLKCDVFVDTIHSIEIVTTTRELLLDEAPEVFDVRAFDEEGNMFSSCCGHLFEWSLSPVGEQDPEEIISFVPFSQSVYQTDEIIKMLESKAVEPSSVKLLIVENLMIRPASEVYITPFSVIHYQLERIKHGHSEVIPMPSNQYYFELTNEMVARLDHASSQVKGLVVGYTQIGVQDKNILEHLSAIKPSSGIHVVYPHHLGYWVLEVGRQYEISVKVFDKLGHVILIEDVISSCEHHEGGIVKATSSLNKLKV